MLFLLAEIYYNEYVFHHSWRGTPLLAEGFTEVGGFGVSIGQDLHNFEFWRLFFFFKFLAE